MQNWIRVSRKERCPICGKPDWCLVARDGTAAICARVQSDRPAGKLGAGWLHRLTDPNYRPSRPVDRPKPAPVRDFRKAAVQYARAMTAPRLAGFARSLGLTAESLRRLGVGWDGEAVVFPMVDEHLVIVGIRRRLPSGKKLSVRGGHEGVFLPSNPFHSGGYVFLCEGPTDTAALLGIGLDAIGRPSCMGGRSIIKAITGRRDVAVVADDDGPGWQGAVILAADLARPGRLVKLIVALRGKDAREWAQLGATGDEVRSAAHNATPVTAEQAEAVPA